MNFSLSCVKSSVVGFLLAIGRQRQATTTCQHGGRARMTQAIFYFFFTLTLLLRILLNQLDKLWPNSQGLVVQFLRV